MTGTATILAPELARAVAAQRDRLDLDLLTRAYQFSALPNEFNKNDRQNFSRYYPRRLPAEVLFDAVNQLTNAPSSFPGLPVLNENVTVVCA